MNSVFCLHHDLKATPWLKMNMMENERRKTRRIKFAFYKLHSCSIHVEVDSKFLKIEDSKLRFKSKFSPINRASTFFIRQSWRAWESEKEFKNVLKNSLSFVISSFKISSHLYSSLWIIHLLSTSLYSTTLCNQGIFSVNNIFIFKYLCFYV